MSLAFCFAASTHDQEVFSFDPEERYCNGFEEVLRRYREIVPHLKLSGARSVSIYSRHLHFKRFTVVFIGHKDFSLFMAGPTSFAPVIEMAMSIVEESGGQYHVLLIVADGQVTDHLDTTLTSFFVD